MTSFMEFMNYLVIEGRRGSHWDQNLKEDRLLTAQLLLNTAHDFRAAAPPLHCCQAVVCDNFVKLSHSLLGNCLGEVGLLSVWICNVEDVS